jgi:IS66 Orf2 like protein
VQIAAAEAVEENWEPSSKDDRRVRQVPAARNGLIEIELGKPGNVREWLATGHTDKRPGFLSLARLVQGSLKRDPHAGDLYVFRGGCARRRTYSRTGEGLI